jgi:hypothetical protein
VSGNLAGAGLVWGPDEAFRVTGNTAVPAGSTLTILPGTIVQVDTTGSLSNGTLITVNGALQALGTVDEPIFFFSERGRSAMTLTQQGSASNGDAWRGLQFYGAGSSTLRHVFLTGAGNGSVVSHPRPPILGLFNTHSLLSHRSVFVDDDAGTEDGDFLLALPEETAAERVGPVKAEGRFHQALAGDIDDDVLCLFNDFDNRGDAVVGTDGNRCGCKCEKNKHKRNRNPRHKHSFKKSCKP